MVKAIKELWFNPATGDLRVGASPGAGWILAAAGDYEKRFHVAAYPDSGGRFMLVVMDRRLGPLDLTPVRTYEEFEAESRRRELLAALMERDEDLITGALRDRNHLANVMADAVGDGEKWSQIEPLLCYLNQEQKDVVLSALTVYGTRKGVR